MKIRDAHHVHCAGIGGIGISALARWLRSLGIPVTGSDLSESVVIEGLRQLGVDVQVGESGKNLPEEVDVLVYSPAISEQDPLRVQAQSRSLVQLSYPEALAQLLEGYVSVAVAGTHGKTTTTAMLGSILEAAGLDPVVVVGSLIPAWSGNFRQGRGKICVFEADEYNRSFLAYHPNHIVVTNIDKDHLDTYRGLEDIMSTFQQFVGQIQPNGSIIRNADDVNSARLKGLEGTTVHEVSVRQLVNLAPRTDTFGIEGFHPAFGRIALAVPGVHMMANALAAAAAASALGVSTEAIQRGLASYAGAWRRFERVGELNQAPVYSDYAHHPTEIQATLDAARAAFPDQRIVVLFQPHQQRRLRLLFDDFVKSLEGQQNLGVIETYEVPGREDRELSDRNAATLVQELARRGAGAQYFSTLNEGITWLQKEAHSGSILLCLGAGSIHAAITSLLSGSRHA